jgi:hypothetical protein
MGKEATCLCQCSNETYQIKLVLEPTELIFRGELKRKIPRSSISGIVLHGGNLSFSADGEQISLTLGAEEAAKWQRALQTPPPSIAQKLGIRATSTVRIYGEIDDGNLHDA